LKAGETPGIEGSTFNLGCGAEITIGELAEKIIKIINRSVEIEVDPKRIRPEKSEVESLLPDINRAQVSLGWIPEVAFDQGLRYTIDWISEHLDMYSSENYHL
jgi:dTDP-glucose 4,6-dehydratase